MQDSLSSCNPEPELGFILGGGEMGEVLRSFNWAETGLGAPAGWPQSLRTAVSMMLNARHPMYVAWGRELHLLYNDNYRQILGAKANDPRQVLGKPFREVWPEVWETVSPMMESTLHGNSLWFEDHAFSLMRNGCAEEVFASFSTSPIRGEAGDVVGVLCVCSETTDKVRSQRERDGALAQLATSVEKLRIATDTAELGMFDYQLQTGVIECNERSRTHFGIGADPISAEALLQMLHPDDRDRVAAEMRAVLDMRDGDGKYQSEYRSVDAHDGQVRWIATTGKVLRDDAGRPLRLIGTTSDITVQKNEEASTRSMAQEAMANARASAKFHTFFEQGNHFAALMAPDGTVLEANRMAVEACGFRREQLIGQPFHQGGWWQSAPEQAGKIRMAVEHARQGTAYRGEVVFFTAGGTRRFADLVIAPVSDPQGRLLFIAATGTDMTERRQVEERLRLLDAIGEATRVSTEPTTIMEHSTRLLGEYLGVTRVAYADMEADNDRFTIRHDWRIPGALSTVGVYSLDLFGSRAASGLRAGKTIAINDVDRELAPEDGGEMFNQIGIKAVVCCPLVRQGRLVALMAVHQECPRVWTADEIALLEAVVDRCWAHIERVRSTEALREADRRKSEFLATLAHELRNPLAPIRNALELLRLGGGKPAVMEKVRSTMERQVGHMVHLINDLLDIARISSGKVVLQVERINLQAVVASAVESSMPAFEAAGHTLSVQVPDEPLWLDADVVRLNQVLTNLLSNAAKYTPRQGQIGIRAYLATNAVLIQVSDTGIGIAKEALESIFEMFSQSPHSIGISNGGLGIGLALVRHLVTLHGGSVIAASPGPGFGSTFTVRLPIAPAPRPGTDPAPTLASAPSRSSPGPSLRILVADDNHDAADTLSFILHEKGHEVRVAYDGEQALRIGTAFVPDLAFLDIGMPLLDGCQVAKAMRSLPSLENLCLVALTGWGADEDRQRTREAGFAHHLLKPASPSELDAILAERMRRKQAA